MKCRACWADKAFRREVKGWRANLLQACGMVPLKCHHCYHKFSVFWLRTIGKTLTPPPIKAAELPPPILLNYTDAARERHNHAAAPVESQRRAA